MGWRFAQFSDAHLGSRLPGLTDAALAAVAGATRESITAALHSARDKGCEAVLVPGDLYDQKGRDAAEQLLWFYEAVADFPTMHFFITPGESDPFSASCPYSVVRPPSNVTLFVHQEWETLELNGVTVTGRALHNGAGPLQMDWAGMPRARQDGMSVLLLHCSLQGAEDGRERRLPLMQVTQKDLLEAQYSYTALGHLHARLEFPRRGGRALAAYAGPPQCLGFDEQGPGGVLIGSLHADGAELAFHHTGKYNWQRRQVQLPELHVENYRLLLNAALNRLARDLGASDIVKLSVGGELAAARQGELQQVLEQAASAVYQLETDTSALRLYGGPDQIELPQDSLLAEFMRRCTAEAAQSGAAAEVYELARRLGWRLFTGQGIPAEISQ
jgi:DNA repair exonuclease SbcCD nuclease subunit